MMIIANVQLGARQSLKYLTHLNSLPFITKLLSCYNIHFTDEQFEAQSV